MNGRPSKTTVDYFPHYTSSGKTLFTLESLYGNDGYAFWFKLLEILGSSENHTFRYENISDWLYLVAKTKVTEEKALAILQTLADLGAIDIDLHRDKTIWSDNFILGLLPVYKKRSTEIPVKPTSRGENTKVPLVSGEKTPQSKGKESKGKESRKDTNTDEQKRIALRLDEIASLRRETNTTPSTLHSWANTIRLMMDKDKRTYEQIVSLLNWYEKNWMNDYVPVISSADAFRKKWLKLLDAIDRASRDSQTTNKKPFQTKHDINDEIQNIGASINERTGFNPYDTIEARDSGRNANQDRRALPE